MSQPPTPPARSRRFEFLDFARGLAIVMALLSHAVLEWRLSADLSDGGVALRCVLRAGTPTFVLIFGVMLELVYFRQVERGEFRAVARRLLQRGLICYLAYLTTIATELLGGKCTVRQALDGAFLLAGPAYGYILKFYMTALWLAVPLLWLRGRFGIAMPLALFTFLWLLSPLLDYVAWENAARLGEVTGLLFGKPRSALSLWHGAIFIGIGMLIGWSLRRWQSQGSIKCFALTMAALGGAAVVGIALLLCSWSPTELFLQHGAARDSFRARQSIEYYVLAFAASLVLLTVCALWVARRGTRSRPVALFLLGRNSLAAFCLGNGLLNLAPSGLRNVSLELKVAMTVLYLLAAPFVVWLWLRIKALATPARAQQDALPQNAAAPTS